MSRHLRCPTSESSFVLLNVKHCPPDAVPCTISIAEHPQLPAACAVSLARTLVDHFISKRNDCCIANNVSLVVMILKFMNSGVLTKIPKAGEKLCPTTGSRGETRKYHSYVGIDYRYKSFHIAVEPSTVDSLHCCVSSFLPGYLHQLAAPLYCNPILHSF